MIKRKVAIAILRSDPSEAYIAEDVEVLSRVIALQIVARTPPDDIADRQALETLRDALLQERWGEALALWIQHGGDAVDVYDDVEVWTDEALDEDHAALEIRMAPIFGDASSRPGN
ncbi:MAG: hypothetical protein QOH26_1018 [Actinomycetota bacterium]|nr:hypothetical protein [Actinomycetota bacterium]